MDQACSAPAGVIQRLSEDEALLEKVAEGLRSVPKALPEEFKWDGPGSVLYEKIKFDAQYYLARSEIDLLNTQGDNLMAQWSYSGAGRESGAAPRHVLVELGSGFGDKARKFMPSLLSDSRATVLYVPIDISQEALQANVRAMGACFPQIAVMPLCMDYRMGLDMAMRQAGRKTVIFTGGNIGNFADGEDTAFLKFVAESLDSESRFLVAADTGATDAKPLSAVVGAYESFHRRPFVANTLKHVNAVAGSDFTMDDWDLIARWDSDELAVIVELKATAPRTVSLANLGTVVHFAAGETLRVSRHAKYSPEKLCGMAEMAGLAMTAEYYSTNKYFFWAEFQKKPPGQNSMQDQRKVFKEPPCTAKQWIDVVDVSAAMREGASDQEKAEVALVLSMALEKLGMVVLVGHQISESTFAGARGAGKEFYALPQSKKDEYNFGLGYGFGGYLKEEENGAQLLGDFTRPPDAVESFTVRGKLKAKVDDDDEETKYDPPSPMMKRTNCNPRLVPPMLREPIQKLQHEWKIANLELCHLIQVALQVDECEFDAVVDKDATGFRVACYPACEGPFSPKQMRYGAHTDSGGLTVLCLDPENPGGLQVQIPQAPDAAPQWLDVPYTPGGLVVNTGELLQHWTGQFWKAPVHQVTMGDHTRPRYSIVLGTVAAKACGPEMAQFSTMPTNPEALAISSDAFLAARAKLHRTTYQDEMDEADPPLVFGCA